MHAAYMPWAERTQIKPWKESQQSPPAFTHSRLPGTPRRRLQLTGVDQRRLFIQGSATWQGGTLSVLPTFVLWTLGLAIIVQHSSRM
jgi:hypothetical protein